MPRNTAADAPKEVKAVASALLALSYKDGMTRQDRGFAGTSGSYEEAASKATDAERARLVEDMIRTQTNSISNHRDRALTSAGLNLDQNGEPSLRRGSTRPVTSRSERAVRTFSNPRVPGSLSLQLTVELAASTRGPPTYAAPRPPSNELELAERLRRQHRVSEAVPLLTSMASNADNEQDRRDAWRLLATIAYERGDYNATEMAFTEALHYTKDHSGRQARYGHRPLRPLADRSGAVRPSARRCQSGAPGVF